MRVNVEFVFTFPLPFHHVKYWRPYYGQTYNGSKGIQWTTTIPDLSPYGVAGNPSIWMLDVYDQVIIARYAGPANDTYPIGYVTYIGYSMEDGHQLWAKMSSLDVVNRWIRQISARAYLRV